MDLVMANLVQLLHQAGLLPNVLQSFTLGEPSGSGGFPTDPWKHEASARLGPLANQWRHRQHVSPGGARPSTPDSTVDLQTRALVMTFMTALEAAAQSSSMRIVRLRALLHVWLAVGDWQQARRLADLLSEPLERIMALEHIMALCDIAIYLLDISETTQAHQILTEAEDHTWHAMGWRAMPAGRSVAEPQSANIDAEGLAMIGKRLAQGWRGVGEQQRAILVATHIAPRVQAAVADTPLHAQSYLGAQLVRLWLAAGVWDQALIVARLMPDRVDRALRLCEIAGWLLSPPAQDQAQDQAKILLAEAESISAEIEDDVLLTRLREELVSTWAAAHEWERAATYAAQMPPSQEQAHAFCALATHLITAGDPATALGHLWRAREIAVSVDDESMQAETLRMIAWQLEEAKDGAGAEQVREEAIRVARAGEKSTDGQNSQGSSGVLMRLTEDLAARGQHDQAQAIAQAILNRDKREWMLRTLPGITATGSSPAL
ncbi:MAG TPA: hypothetical protein VKY74_17400 [Chloroflexia bacterium]|nr:hypothetical protein [Chloroflexia bacterium]